MLLQNSTGTPATAELTGAAPAVISQNIILKRQRFLFVCLFFNNLVLSRTPGGVISKLGSSTWEKKKGSDIEKIGVILSR